MEQQREAPGTTESAAIATVEAMAGNPSPRQGVHAGVSTRRAAVPPHAPPLPDRAIGSNGFCIPASCLRAPGRHSRFGRDSGGPPPAAWRRRPARGRAERERGPAGRRVRANWRTGCDRRCRSGNIRRKRRTQAPSTPVRRRRGGKRRPWRPASIRAIATTACLVYSAARLSGLTPRRIRRSR